LVPWYLDKVTDCIELKSMRQCQMYMASNIPSNPTKRKDPILHYLIRNSTISQEAKAGTYRKTWF